MARRLSLLLLTGLLACSRPVPPVDPQAFDGAAAYRHVEFLVGLGPRLPQTAPSAKAADYLVETLRASGLVVEEQVFHAGTPRGPTQFRNVVARTRRQTGRDKSVLILGSHYDTKWISGFQIPGANDGGSSTGVLLELARLTAEQPDLWFVFFDGEEAFDQYNDEDGLWGSRYFVESLRADDQLATVRALILLDMIGDCDLHIAIPSNGTGELVQRVFDAAKAAGHRDVFSLRQGEILDDHVPFLRAGIPAVNLIDFDYGSAPGRHDYWHTDEDTLDKICPQSMAIVGRTVLHLLQMIRR